MNPESSNRTFMELKFAEHDAWLSVEGCSNRTFMELKLSSLTTLSKVLIVLIVPLWN